MEHSREKLEERNISKKKVEEILANPDEVRAGKHDRTIAQKYENDKLTGVVYNKIAGGGYRIVTAYKISPERYGDRL